jgi:hypothetical protein
MVAVRLAAYLVLMPDDARTVVSVVQGRSGEPEKMSAWLCSLSETAHAAEADLLICRAVLQYVMRMRTALEFACVSTVASRAREGSLS